MNVQLLAISVIVAIVLLVVIKIYNGVSKWINIWKISNNKEKFYRLIKAILMLVITANFVCALFLMISRFELVQSNKYIQFLFVTEKNKFNWIGITSVLAIISLTFTAWDSRRKLKADVISKSRIKWMETVRPLVAEFTEKLAYYILATTDFLKKVDGKTFEEGYAEKKIIDSLRLELRVIHNEILLNVPDDGGDNEVLLVPISELWDLFENTNILEVTKDRDAMDKFNIEFFEKQENLIELARGYFKCEWEKAKQGK